MTFSCRYYKNEFPGVDNIIMIKIIKLIDYGYKVILLEYNNMEGFLALTEISRRRQRKKKLVKIGDILPVFVLRVSTVNRIIDVSKKGVTQDDIKLMNNNYKIWQKINRLGKEICYLYKKFHNNKLKMEEIMDKTVWTYYENNQDIEAYDFYKTIICDPKSLMNSEYFSEEFKMFVVKHFKDRTIRQDIILEQELNIFVISEEGINGIKDILDINPIYLSNNNNENNIKFYITMVSPPKYKIVLHGSDIEIGKMFFSRIISDIIDKSKKYNSQVTPCSEIKIAKLSDIDIKLLSNNEINKLIL
jgi:translation initiation factor 2 alpha subunit (eIF-2alpha)